MLGIEQTVRFFRSGETISHQFHRVLRTINDLAPDITRQVGNDAPRGPVGFEGVVGGIDGTQIPAFVPSQLLSTFRNRKGTLSQPVMVACGFDLNFQYVLPGWEGSATDARVLQNALARPDPLVIPRGRYYLIDEGYANQSGFLALYRTARYHLADFRRKNHVNSREVFNKMHRQARNVIERAFGILKNSYATKKNNVSNAVIDDEMLTLLQEQIEMGKKGDRGFKEEAYIVVASAMTKSSNGAYVMTSSSVKNRYKHLKQLYYAMKEMMTASGFGYNPVRKRVVADEALWNTWLEGHPTARPLKTKSIDYEKMGLESSNYSNSDDVSICVDDLECDSKGGGTSGESSSKKKEVRKRARDVEVLVMMMKEPATLVQHALDNLADSIKNSEPHKRIVAKMERNKSPTRDRGEWKPLPLSHPFKVTR
ncbi:putative nuclease HARBI1 [Cinnamomum micranthum f. kanehirae]|uniref:Putative nuclease HARBI1 n=1 Tax=Cinnamomum micranthum f. kanehirae TaxID=337451 RepID=A0A443NP34_9MAGN|nr:putative nuclease HARBI1 [Cinnamomum micranthum f. kanehirae]